MNGAITGLHERSVMRVKMLEQTVKTGDNRRSAHLERAHA